MITIIIIPAYHKQSIWKLLIRNEVLPQEVKRQHMVRTFISMFSIPSTWEYVCNNICQDFQNQTFDAKLKLLDDASLHQSKFSKLVITMNAKSNHPLHLYLKSKQRSHCFSTSFVKYHFKNKKRYHCNAFVIYTIQI